MASTNRISTCHVKTLKSFGEVARIGGVVPDGIVKVLRGYEAGQAGMSGIFGLSIDACMPTVACRGGRTPPGVHDVVHCLKAHRRENLAAKATE